MKRRLCALLIAMIILIPCHAFAKDIEFFDTIVVDGVNYYDMLGSKPSTFNSGPDTFFKDYLQIQTTQGSTTYPSVMEEWCQVAEAILAGTTPDSPQTKWDFYQSDARYTPMEKSYSAVGSANSIDAAAKAAVAAHNSMKVPSGCDQYNLMNPSGLDNTERNCVYYIKHGFPKHEEGVTTGANGSYVIIFSDFQIAQVVSDGYVQTDIMDNDNYKLTKYDPTSVNAQVFTNDTVEPAQATASLSTTVSETVTLTTTDSYQYSATKSWNIGGKVMLGNKDWYGGGEISGGFSQTWTNVTGKSFANAKAQSSGTTNTSTLSAALPPYTEATVIQSKGKGAMNIRIDLPVAVFYNVTIIYLCNNYITSRDSFTAYYRGATGRNSTDARDDLYQRVMKGAAEPDEVNNTTDKMKELAQKIYTNIPLSKADTGFDYQLEYTQSRLSDVRPMKNLTRVELKDKRTNITLNVDEPLDVSTVQVVGLNEASAPYFGFDDAQGSWILEDTSGKPIKDNANEYIKLAKDTVTGKLTLTALKPGGTVILKFQVPENTYVDVEKTPVGSDKIVYIDPKTVDNQATLTVRTTANTSGYTIVADGEITGHEGDDPIKLDGDVSPVSAYALDADGLEVTVPITWRAELSNGTISIDKENTLTFLKAGENKIRAEWGSIHSDWLPVQVIEAQRLESLELSDPRELLATVRWSDSTISRTYDLTGLKLKCLDQFEKEMKNVDGLVWYAAKDKGDPAKIDDPKAFKVTGSGIYEISVQNADGSVVSNSLKLTVEEAPRPVSITLADDEDVPLLGDYILHSGSDTFDLTKLHAAAIDQYGDKYPVDMKKLTWVVNGQDLSGSTLTVDAAGKYAIRCRLPGMEENSNAVALNVTESRVPAEMTLADDPYDPLLADYKLHDGDDTFKLSKLTATCVDEYGEDYPLKPSDLIWMVNGKAIQGDTLTVDKAGTYAICFTLSGTTVQSNALTLTVTAARTPGEMILEDDPYKPLLADYVLHDGDDTFKLSKLSASCADEYGDPYPLDPSTLIWLVNGEAIQGDTLTVDKAGTYAICFTTKDSDVKSNVLTLTVTEARTPTEMTLADDPYDPLLADYKLHDGDDTFKLSKLTATCVDEYGEDYPLKPGDLIWLVNGKAIQGDTLTVDKAGTYAICFTLSGATVQSNVLTLTVTAARTPGEMILEDDPYKPLLADYVLHDGDDTFKLSKLSASCADEYGDPYPLDPSTLIWLVNGEAIQGDTLTVDKAGTYAICFTTKDSDVKSNVLTLTVTEARVPTELTLADDPYKPLLADYILHDGDDSFKLSRLTASCADQYGDDYPIDPAKLTWMVNGDALKGDTLTVDRAGTYGIYFTLDGFKGQSNALTLNVLAARIPAVMTLTDDPYTPLLADYILHDGSDAFHLSKLTAACVDQYDDDYPIDPAKLTWMVNGEALAGDTLTVDKAGAYGIYFTLKGFRGQSNVLTLNVLAARVPAEMTLADDPYNPLLAEYVLHDGDDTFQLSKLTKTCKDQYGDDYPIDLAKLVWTVNGAALDGDTLTVSEMGTYDVCFTLDGAAVKSNILTLKVLAARVPALMKLEDDPYNPLLAEYKLYDDDNTFQLSKLTATCEDQYGAKYPMAPSDIIWLVNDAAIEGDTLAVDETGAFDVRFTLPGTKVRSNALTLNVLPARHLYELTIADDSVSPMLEDYPLGSGSDKFDLYMLVIGAVDQYGDPHPFDDLDWYVNGKYLPDGVLTVTKEGSYVIHAVATEGDLFAESNTLTLKVVPYVLSLTLNSEALTMSPGEQYQLVATTFPVKRDDAFTYISSRPSVAEVDGNGLITAKAEGKAVITVTNTTRVSSQCVVTVGGVPEKVTLTPNELILGINETGQLSAKVLPKGASTTLTYRSSDDSVATVTSSGKVTGVSVGTATLRVETHNGLYDECFVKVVKAASVIDGPDALVLGLKETFDLGSAVKLSARRKSVSSNALAQLTYRSMDPSIATVSDKGVVTAKKIGETGITVTSYNGVMKAIPVTVKKAPKSVKLAPKKKTLKKTDRLQLKVTLSAGSAGSVTFKSSKPKVISVAPDGTVTAHKKGKAKITVRTYNGKKAKCTIICNGKNPLTLKVTKSLDLSKPDSCVVVKPSVAKNWEDYKLTITAKKGKKNLGDVTDRFDIKLTRSNTIRIRVNPDSDLAAGTVCTVNLKVDQGYRVLKASKSFKLKMSGAKAAPAPDPLALNCEPVDEEIEASEVELEESR